MAELRILLSAESDALAQYMDGHHIHLPPSVIRRRAKEAFVEEGLGEVTQSGKVKVKVEDLGYDEKYNMVR
jgi:hypothetical protein